MMPLDEVLLQGAQLVGGDVLVAQRAEARGDSSSAASSAPRRAEVGGLFLAKG